jgi:hypothetical protein
VLREEWEEKKKDESELVVSYLVNMRERLNKWTKTAHQNLLTSRKLTPAESRYPTIEKEALAIKWAISKFCYFLAGRHFFVETDHDPLWWLHVMSNPNEKLARWILALQAYDFMISSRLGAANTIADALSRYQE